MATIGLVTTEGFSKSLAAASNEGWVIRPTKFAISETKGEFTATRRIADIEPVWYENWISGREIISANSIMFFCAIPPEQGGNVQRNINEIYLYAEDNEGELFLLWLAQPENTVIYEPSGTTRMRLQVTIANLNITDIYQFVYTQAQEIEAHNIDPNAHPDFQRRFETMGYAINPDNYEFAGQLTDETPIFDSAVEDGDMVYFNVASEKYERALIDGTSRSYPTGVAAISDLYKGVRSGGFIQTFYHEDPYLFPSDSIVYLSTIDAGKLTLERTNMPLGVHLSNGLIYFAPAAGYLKRANIGGMARNSVYTDNDYNASNLDTILADLSTGSFGVYLPASPVEGDIIRVIDSRGYAKENNLTIFGQGAAINQSFEDFVVDVNFAMISFLYDSRENNWLVDLGGARFTGYVE